MHISVRINLAISYLLRRTHRPLALAQGWKGDDAGNKNKRRRHSHTPSVRFLL